MFDARKYRNIVIGLALVLFGMLTGKVDMAIQGAATAVTSTAEVLDQPNPSQQGN